MNHDPLAAIQKNNVRLILHNNIGSANCISQKEWYELSFLTLDTLKKSLMSSFGKDASNTLIIHENISSSSVFTQDGIHIVSSFEFASLIQTYIARYVQYIGERVEKGARDGTTTAMVLFVDILYAIYKDFFDKIFVVNTEKSIQEINILLNKYVVSVKEVLTDLINFTNDRKMSMEEITSSYHLSKEEIIYNLSYITSKGNKNLSNTMVDMFKDMPIELYDYFVYYRSDIETENPFEVHAPEYDYELVTLIRSGISHFNTELNTVYEGNVDLVLFPEMIYDTDVDKIKEIEATIESLGDNVVIIWNTINDKLVRIWEKNFTNKTLIFIQYVNYVQNLRESGIELSGLLKGCYKTEDSYFIRDVFVRIEQNNIKINNIIKFHNDGYINEKYYEEGEFKDFVDEVASYISKLKNTHTKSDVEFELKEAIKIYRKLVAPKYPILRIGGRTLDHLSLIDVIEDTVGSLTIALEKGCIVDGLLHISKYLKKQYNRSYKENNQSTIYRIYEIFTKEFTSLFEIANTNTNSENNCVIQNYMTYRETFDRLFEVLPKLILTTEVLVPGTISLKGEKDG